MNDDYSTQEAQQSDGFREIESGSGTQDTGSQEATVGNGDTGANTGEHDREGASDVEQASSGQLSDGDEDAGNQEQGGTVDDTVETVEPTDYTAQLDEITARLDGVYASSVVLCFALFMAVGAVVVQTLVKSFEV